MKIRLYTGTPRYIGDDGQFSAIWKQPAAGPLRITKEGLVGDVQADRRVHGGPERRCTTTPARTTRSSPHASADRRCAGRRQHRREHLDRRLRRIHGLHRRHLSPRQRVVQVSQPRLSVLEDRRPLRHRRHHRLHRRQRPYRLVLPRARRRRAASGDDFALIERPAGAVPLATPGRPGTATAPTPSACAIAHAPGLTPAWTRRIDERLAWLAANPGGTGMTGS